MSTALATGNRQVLRETDSPTGRHVQLLRERGTYAGAQPYYTVATFKPTGRPTAIRHTPFLTRAEPRRQPDRGKRDSQEVTIPCIWRT